MLHAYDDGVNKNRQAIVHAAATVYLHHLGQWCMGVLVHGSALKGDYIPGCSDIDFQLYLEPAAFTQKGQLPLEVCLALQRDLAQIEPFPFQYIQGHTLPLLPGRGTWARSQELIMSWLGHFPSPKRRRRSCVCRRELPWRNSFRRWLI